MSKHVGSSCFRAVSRVIVELPVDFGRFSSRREAALLRLRRMQAAGLNPGGKGVRKVGR